MGKRILHPDDTALNPVSGNPVTTASAAILLERLDEPPGLAATALVLWWAVVDALVARSEAVHGVVEVSG